MSLRNGILVGVLLIVAPTVSAQGTTALQSPSATHSTQHSSAPETEEQILVHVEILEIPLTKLRQLGVDAQWFSDRGVDVQQVPQVSDVIVGPVEDQAAPSVTKMDAKLSRRLMNALKRQGLAKVLSQSTVSTVSGRSATVHVGGEFPVPAGRDSESPVEFCRFGTDLRVDALTLGNNLVRLDVVAQVRAVDDSRVVEIDGVRVPGLRTCSCESRVEMSFGDTSMLNGLVQQRTESRQLEGGQIETEVVEVGLLVLITPELAPPSGPLANGDSAQQR